MLKTIRTHKNLHYLTDRLPDSNYHEHDLSRSPKEKCTKRIRTEKSASTQARNINLPKLDKIITRNSANYQRQEDIIKV